MRRRGGCRPRIVNSENLQCVDLQRLFRSELRRFQVEIGDFVTKRRSGFGRQTGGGGAKKGCSRRAAECWFPPPTSCQSRSSVCPFRGSPKGPPRRLRGPRRGRTGTKGGVRRCRAAQAAPRSGDARQVRRRTRTPVRRDGRVFYRSTKATSKTHAAGRVLRSLYRSPGSPSFLPVDESLGMPHRSGGAQRSRAPAPATGRKLQRLGGMTPSSSCASV